jgi:hypothetical protein
MADNKYLDLTGLTHFWEKSKTYINDADAILKDSKIGYINVSEDGTLEFWSFAPEYNDNKEVSNGAKLIADASGLLGDALKDGMLSNVTIVTSSPKNPIKYDKPEPYTDGTKFIEFTWNSDVDGDPNTEGVQIKKVYLKVDEIGKVYQGSETITIDDTTNTISVSEVDDSQIKVSNFKVGGTPLGEYLKSKGVSEIRTDGQNLEEVLKALFSDETYPASSITYPTALKAVTVGKPTISITNHTSNIAEIGTKGTLSAGSNGSSTNNTITYSGFTYGYSNANDNSADSGTNKPGNVTVTGVADSGSNYSLSFTTDNGFGSATIDSKTGSNGAAVSQSKELEYALGTNKVTVTVTSPSYSATVSTQPAKYIVSSLGATSAEEVVNAAPSVTTITAAANTNTNSITVTGVYPCYSNVNGSGLDSTPDTKLAIANTSSYEVEYPGESSTAKRMFMCPTGRTVEFIDFNPTSGKFDTVVTWTKLDEQVTKTLGSYTVTYDVYVRTTDSSNISGGNKVKFNMSKSTSAQ